jgi:hypothetical protein
LVVSTSLRPAPPTRSLSKELSWILPRTIRLNRGGQSIRQVASTAFSAGAKQLLIISTAQGNPSFLEAYSLSEGVGKLKPSCRGAIGGYRLVRDSTLSERPRRPTAVVLHESVDEPLREYVQFFFSSLGMPIEPCRSEGSITSSEKTWISVEQTGPRTLVFTLQVGIFHPTTNAKDHCVVPGMKIRWLEGIDSD